MASAETSTLWPFKATFSAVTLCLGTAIHGLFNQHVSDVAPGYFYSIAVSSPFLGLIGYSLLIVFNNQIHVIQQQQNAAEPKGDGIVASSSSSSPHQFTWPLVRSALKYCTWIGLCFAVSNILMDFGRSGSAPGVPDVPTVLSVVLGKLIVPTSLALESVLDRHRPTAWQLSGVSVLLSGVLLTALLGKQHGDSDSDNSTTTNGHQHSPWYSLKVLCLILSSVPTALGFYIVKVARRNLPEMSGIQLWLVLCVPELFFSIGLSLASQPGPLHDRVQTLWNGVVCVLMGLQPPDTQEGDATNAPQCSEAAAFFWTGLPFGFALNLAIPILIQHKGSTSVPLFRALALPIGSLLAMSHLDMVIHTPFSWSAVAGVLLATLGLLLFYGADIQSMLGAGKDGGAYTAIRDRDLHV